MEDVLDAPDQVTLVEQVVLSRDTIWNMFVYVQQTHI